MRRPGSLSVAHIMPTTSNVSYSMCAKVNGACATRAHVLQAPRVRHVLAEGLSEGEYHIRQKPRADKRGGRCVCTLRSGGRLRDNWQLPHLRWNRWHVRWLQHAHQLSIQPGHGTKFTQVCEGSLSACACSFLLRPCAESHRYSG
jgi:hypothetical protein